MFSQLIHLVLKYIYVQVNEIHIQLRNLSSIDSLNDQFALVQKLFDWFLYQLAS